MFAFKYALLVLLLVGFQLRQVEGGGGKCAASSSYYCPNCGGFYVSDCQDCDGYFNIDVEHDICFDRTLFSTQNTDPENPDDHYHYLWRDLLGMLIWFLTSGIATAAGVGGGGIYVPLGIILLQFSPKASSGLSQASIFGAAMGGLLLNFPNKHPNTHIKNPGEDNRTYTRPLIDYDMALFFAPMQMAGAVLGVLIQRVLPNWLYLTLAGVILGLTAYKTFSKYFQTHKKEVELRKAAESAAKEAEVDGEVDGEDPITEAEGTNNVENCMDHREGTDGNVDSLEGITEAECVAGSATEEQTKDEVDAENGNQDPQELIEARRVLLEDDERQYPREKFLGLLLIWAGLLIISLFQGGKGVPSVVGITCASPWYGVLIALQFIWLFGIATYYGFGLIRRQAKKDACHYPFVEHDVVWNMSKIRLYACFTFISGIVAGLIGVGGGMILGPLMLIMGVHPRVSSATNASLIVLVSSSVAVLYITSGLVPWQYAVTFFSVCFVGALFGKAYIDGVVKRSGRASLLILTLAIIIALSMIGCLVIALIGLAEAGWCLEGFRQFCSVSNSNSMDENGCPSSRLLFEAAQLSAK